MDTRIDRRPDSEIRKLLGRAVSSVGVELKAFQMEQLETHFGLLLKWNQKINLTAIRKPREIAGRHFGESLFLSKLLPAPQGLMIDVGSGAGFPGLPLKIAWPGTAAVLLEPNHKKATFLNEVVRSCGLEGVEVRSERLEDAVQADLAGRAALVTMRAVKPSAELLQGLAKFLQPVGVAALFVGAADAASLTGPAPSMPRVHWQAPVPIPQSEQRVILIGHVAVAML
jgi:16S rRNA (guanine(527)-N(7))-methyltransferase RsmG